MKTTIIDIGDGKKEARIEVEWDRVRADYDDILEGYLTLPVPGFRPGKAPRSRIEARYQKEILDDVGIRCAGRFSRTALEKEGISTTGPIAVTELDIELGGPLRFTAEFLELPSFDIPEYGGFAFAENTDTARRDEISRYLLEKTTLEVPDELVRQELLFDGMTGVPADSEEWLEARNRVKLLLILDAIARRDGIEVDERDVDERIELIAGAMEIQPNLLKQQLLWDGGVSRLSRFILAEKTLEYLLERSERGMNDENGSEK